MSTGLEIKDLERACMLEVLTINEVHQHWGKSRNTILLAILRRDLVARQAGGAKGLWLVSRSSVISRWGQPKIEFTEDEKWLGR